jgi:hypothetical protein
MHYVTRRTHRMEKHKFGITCPDTLFVESVPVPPKHEKACVIVSWHGRTRMHYLTHISHCMQKHKFGVTCPIALFMETALGPPEQEKWCVNVSRRRCTGMHYVTHRCKNTSSA